MDYDYKKYDAQKVNDSIDSYAHAVDGYTSEGSYVEAGYAEYHNNDTYGGKAADASKIFINIGTKKIPIYKNINDRCNQSCKDFFINKNKNQLNDIKINVDKNNRNDSNIFYKKLENKSSNIINLTKLKKRILLSNKSIMISSTKIRNKKNSYNNSSDEIKNQKSFKLQNFNYKNSIREIFYCKPLIIKCMKQSASLSNNNQMRKKNLFPFKNSFGVVLDDANKKTYFLKGSIDFIYPRITVKNFMKIKKSWIM